MDELLGPIFEAAHVDWPSHIDTLTAFWAWQLLGEQGYEGNPLRAHEPVHEVTPFADEHFERWLELFTGTIDEHFVGPSAEAAKVRARGMASARCVDSCTASTIRCACSPESHPLPPRAQA